MRVPAVLSIVGSLIAVAALPLAAQRGGGSAADEAAIRALVARYGEAREREDPDAIAAVLTEDADQHTSAGTWRRGRDTFVAGTIESSRRNPGNRRIVVETVRFLTAKVAIVDGPYDIAGAAAAQRLWTTFVVARTADGWRIAAIRNMVPTGPAVSR
jgi:uncharacterized protein (TIGR02246 family)